MRHLVTLCDISATELQRIFLLSRELKERLALDDRTPRLPGRVLALLFEKQSLRTRVSFESGMIHLGGGSMFLSDDVGFGKRESMSDFGRVLGEMVDAVVIRAKRHESVVSLAEHCTCPVINGLTDQAHPCQAIADLFTIGEALGELDGKTLTWVGDANNVARSLARACGLTGMSMVMATPPGYRFSDAEMESIAEESPSLELDVTDDPVSAVERSDVVYTDVWASMGQESEREKRKADFADYQVNGKLMAHAREHVIFMHCLPARRGEEVTDEVIDGPHSVTIQQAANRMHAQKGILVWLLTEAE